MEKIDIFEKMNLPKRIWGRTYILYMFSSGCFIYKRFYKGFDVVVCVNAPPGKGGRRICLGEFYSRCLNDEERVRFDNNLNEILKLDFLR